MFDMLRQIVELIKEFAEALTKFISGFKDKELVFTPPVEE